MTRWWWWSKTSNLMAPMPASRLYAKPPCNSANQPPMPSKNFGWSESSSSRLNKRSPIIVGIVIDDWLWLSQSTMHWSAPQQQHLSEFKQQNEKSEWIQNVLKIQNHFLMPAVLNENTNLKILRIVWRRVLSTPSQAQSVRATSFCRWGPEWLTDVSTRICIWTVIL